MYRHLGYKLIFELNDKIISTGYNGVSCSCKYCVICKRMNVPRFENYLSRVCLVENVIISAARLGMIGATLYLACNEKNAFPCKDCQRLIINAGIKIFIAE